MRTDELAKSPEALQPCFVAVHVGAGYHSVKQESAYLQGRPVLIRTGLTMTGRLILYVCTQL